MENWKLEEEMETGGEGHLGVFHLHAIRVDVAGRNHAIALQIEGDILREKDVETEANAGNGAGFVLDRIFAGAIAEEESDERGKCGSGAISIDENRIEKMVLDECGDLHLRNGIIGAIQTGKSILECVRAIVAAMEFNVDFIAQKSRGFESEGKSCRIGALGRTAPSKG